MSSKTMSQIAISAQGLGKKYFLYPNAQARLSHLLWSRGREAKEFHALKDVNFSLKKGGSLGIIGHNGAGKSTLLQLICGTTQASHGTLNVEGRIAPLLELGAGFNSEFTGRENIFMNAAVLGLQQSDIRDRIDQIIEFAGIGEFIDQPVRTYSSGMFVRLAFSIATSISPDILVIDEAIAVGDGQFARKSFDRIMSLRDQGVTLLLCSHSLFQVESLCDEVLWLHHGEVRGLGPAAEVIANYNEWLNSAGDSQMTLSPTQVFQPLAPVKGHAVLTGLKVYCDGVTGHTLQAKSGHSRLDITLSFASDPELPVPALGVMIYAGDGRVLTSTGSWIDGVVFTRDEAGNGTATLTYTALPFLKGKYALSVYLMCERGLHIYAAAEHVALLLVSQDHLEQGLVSLPHVWHQEPTATQVTEAT